MADLGSPFMEKSELREQGWGGPFHLLRGPPCRRVRDAGMAPPGLPTSVNLRGKGKKRGSHLEGYW